ncbi:hypothetical protein N7457_003712 [Penicillium paradoxum]|uniref:uncharacterized protein n=1 Tax=Penicillium paradoxum TaxID=176176 RepID=UPI002549872A|nr:uncharacterized protein N7457_003712 [Penicillium paradoxum]KAJ5788722.1 hypothetical protein N7457_003712 [Penicillium paradoxum]
MSAMSRKPGTPGSSSKSSPADPHSNTGSTTRGHARSPSNTSNGVNRSPSSRGSTPVSARAAARKPARSTLSMSNVPRVSNDHSDEEARAQNAALIVELREQLQKAETASEQYQKQLGVLQMRLDEAISEQSKLEDQAHERDTRIEALNSEIRDQGRQIRDLEQNHESERNAMLQEKEQQTSREEEMQATIQRLKDSMAQKDMRINAEGDRHQVSRSSSFRNRSSPDVDGQFAPSSHIERSPSRNNSTLLLQKDKLIESLRLELAESQIKLVEMENAGGGRQRELEKELLEARMANARLMEDNESYQLLLSEKTLTGDFAKGEFMRDANPTKESASGLGSLADELESVDESPEADAQPPSEAELKALKDQNKALTLYIERIISRLLMHDGFEHILDRNEDDDSSTTKTGSEKDLPPTPPRRTMLRLRVSCNEPSRLMLPPPTPTTPSQNENPNTAPSIPFRTQSVRIGHRRSRSEQVDPSAASVVGHMYRGRNSGGPISPTGMGPGSRQSMFSGAASYISGMSRAPSLSSQPERLARSSSPSITSDPHGDGASTGATSSPPRSIGGMNNYTGAVMQQDKLRPLRLVSETTRIKEEEEAARKKANRASWIPWLNRTGTDEMAPPQ